MILGVSRIFEKSRMRPEKAPDGGGFTGEHSRRNRDVWMAGDRGESHGPQKCSEQVPLISETPF